MLQSRSMQSVILMLQHSLALGLPDIRTCPWMSCIYIMQANPSQLHYNLYLYCCYIYKYYVIVVTWARGICLICMPEARGLRAYISGKSRVHMLQVICNTSGTLKICPNLMSIFPPLYIVTGTRCDCGTLFHRCHDVLAW